MEAARSTEMAGGRSASSAAVTQPAPSPPPKPWDAGQAVSEGIEGVVSTASTPDDHLAQPAKLREDQIRNAVAFLSHEKVRPASVATKRSFLTRKGLKEAEIDAAFKRVPQAMAEAPASAMPSSADVTTAEPAQLAPVQQALRPPPHPVVPGFRWTQVVLGMGTVVAGGFLFRELVWPYLWHWYERLQRGRDAERELLEAAAEQAKVQHEQLMQALQKQQEALTEAVVQLKESVQLLSSRQEGRMDAMAAGMPALQQQILELSQTISAAPGPSDAAQAVPPPCEHPGLLTRPRLGLQPQQVAPGISLPPRQAPAASGGAGAAYDAAATQLQELQAEVASMRQLLEAAPPASVAASRGSSPGSAPRSTAVQQQQQQQPVTASANGVAAGVAGAAPRHPMAARSPWGGAASNANPYGGYHGDQPPWQAAPSYQQVLDMLDLGIQPPGIRTDIDDVPSAPDQAPSTSAVQRRPKPWERADKDAMPAAVAAAGSGLAGPDGAPPPWQLPEGSPSWTPPDKPASVLPGPPASGIPAPPAPNPGAGGEPADPPAAAAEKHAEGAIPDAAASGAPQPPAQPTAAPSEPQAEPESTVVSEVAAEPEAPGCM